MGRNATDHPAITDFYLMTLPIARSCPVCTSTDTVVVGPILHPPVTVAAGVPFELGDSKFTLRRCRRCGFQFKDPTLDAARLIACYTAADAAYWEHSPDPHQRQFDVLLEVAERHAPGRRILDVGCFNGAMLSYFGPSWRRHGIEPSVKAAEVARSRGVDVLASTLDGLDDSHGQFDIITAIDVVEHVVDPLPFFRQVRDRLAPGGVFLLLTGDTSSFAWRMQGGLYWYCSFPEHVSFYDQASLNEIAKLLEMECVDFRSVYHKRTSMMRWISDTFKTTIYLTGRAVRGFGLPPLRRMFVERRGPSVQSAKDHLICVLSK
jgi:SAM-dependent methyltransferase